MVFALVAVALSGARAGSIVFSSLYGLDPELRGLADAEADRAVHKVVPVPFL
jgi:hypothetical protein